MVENKIRDIKVSDISFVVENVRPEDDLESVRSIGEHTSTSLIKSVDVSEYTGIIVIRGLPASIFGVRRMGEIGIPWSISTKVVDRYPAEFYKLSTVGIDLIKGRYDVLFNYVDASYTKAIRWLKKLGFSIGEQESFGVSGLQFRPFYWRRYV